MRLTREFYHRDCLEVAPDLVGKVLVRTLEDGSQLRLRISETEAYRGEEDTACHAHKGRTKRTEILYREPGRIYVYLCYGVHWLLNIVTGEKDSPQAVLIRACVDAEGPGKLTKRLQVDKTFNDTSILTQKRLWIEEDGKRYVIVPDTRVGIGYASEEDQARLWRFKLRAEWIGGVCGAEAGQTDGMGSAVQAGGAVRAAGAETGDAVRNVLVRDEGRADSMDRKSRVQMARGAVLDPQKEIGERKKLRRIGVTGGVGAGKSRVLAWLEKERGARIIRTDDVAKELMEPGEEGYRQVVEALGTSFIKEDGTIDRPALAKIIFLDEKARETVDQITHPLVWERLEQMLAAAEDDRTAEDGQAEAGGRTAKGSQAAEDSRIMEGSLAAEGSRIMEGSQTAGSDQAADKKGIHVPVALVVVESALFDKTALCFLDEMWYVYAPEEVRIRRLMESRGYSLERCQSMLESQPKDEAFCGMASYIIDNGGAWEDAVRQLEWVSGPGFSAS